MLRFMRIALIRWPEKRWVLMGSPHISKLLSAAPLLLLTNICIIITVICLVLYPMSSVIISRFLQEGMCISMNKASVFNDITNLNAAAAYVRVSSQKQSETSLETQLDTIKGFARQNQLSIIRVYKDKITASGSREREDFNRMISDALEGVFNIILVYKYDRFHRDNVEEQNILRRLENNRIFVLSVTENIDTTTPAGRLLRWIMSGVNRFYIENLQQEIYDKTTKVALKAYFMGGVPPYGFKIVSRRDTEASRNRRLYAVDEEEAPAVRLAFELYAQGYSYATIIQRLDAQGYRTRSGGLWSMQTIYSMLRNEKYNGTYVFRKGNKKR